MYRQYFLFGDYFSTFDCQLQMAIITFANAYIFRALYLASTSDSGKAPQYTPDDFNETFTDESVCKKCNALRKDPFVHHCSTCNMCVEMMDHHCYWLGRCVGKGNIRYFMQFCFSLALLLAYAVVKQVWFFYTYNRQRQIGVQGLTWLFLPTPFHIPWMFYFSEADGGYNTYVVIDTILAFNTAGLTFFLTMMPLSVLKNLGMRTSEVDKLRPGRTARVFHRQRSW